MPYINVSTSAKIENKQKLLEEISILISSLTNKSTRFVCKISLKKTLF